MESDWGRKQFTAYLGENTALWEPHDATVLMRERGFPGPVLIDTGTADQFGDLLKTEALAEAIAPAASPRRSGCNRATTIPISSSRPSWRIT
jgi:S-formylglutathione hydrolase